MKRLICAIIALFLFVGCAVAQETKTDIGGGASAMIPEDWQAASAPSGAMCAYSLGSGSVAFYDASGLGGTPEAVIDSLKQDEHYVNVKAGLIGSYSCVTFDLSSSAESGIIVIDEGSARAVCLRYSPISDSELGLIVRAVAQSVSFD